MVVSPDDNFPLRELVTVLQRFGLYAYTWRRTEVPQNSVFSLPLFLWSLFLNVFVLSASYLPQVVILTLDRSSIGNTVLVISALVLSYMAILTEIIMPFRSRKLAKIFDLLKRSTVVDNHEATRLHIRKVLVLMGIVTLIICSGVLVFALQTKEVLRVYEVLLLIIVCLLIPYRYSLVIVLFKTSISLVSDHFLETVLNAVAESDNFLQTLHSSRVTKSKEKTEKEPIRCETPSLIIINRALKPLYELEEKILQVENIRDEVVRYHFVNVSLMIIIFMVLIVTSGFATLSNNLLSGCSPMFAIFSSLILFNLCSAGQNVTNKAKEAADKLKIYSSTTHLKEIKEQ
ncbi:hypothetical protein SK128_007432, partial [Halocaridina rubra]